LGEVLFSRRERRKVTKGEKMNMLKRFIRDESGLELSEYAIMAGMIILVAVGVIYLIGGKITAIFQGLSDELDKVPTGPA
jgi:Flp pilus assembly pilin Flp